MRAAWVRASQLNPGTQAEQGLASPTGCTLQAMTGLASPTGLVPNPILTLPQPQGP